MLTPSTEDTFQLEPEPMSPPYLTLLSSETPPSQHTESKELNGENLMSQEAISLPDGESINFDHSDIPDSSRDTLPSKGNRADDKESDQVGGIPLEEEKQPTSQNSSSTNVEDLQERLRQVEQRFSGVSLTSCSCCLCL